MSVPDIAPYSVHPSFAHWSAMLSSLEERTGKDMEEWLSILRRAKTRTPAAIRAILKAHKLGAATVSLIVDHAAGNSLENYDPKAHVAQLFKGPKAALLPLYESVLHFALELGADVKACPCATMVPLYRNHVFAQIKSSTKSRLDVGLALAHVKFSKPKSAHLIDTGGIARKDRITHRLELCDASDFNQFAKDWLLRAYNADVTR